MSEEKQIRQGISLCMIVKNEESTIVRAIASVRSIVDEIIVVDTGSEDMTCAKAEACGAQVFSFDWCDDFSKARNFSLQQASYSWILVVDADEVIAEKDLPLLRAVVEENKCYAAVLTQRNYCNSSDAEGWQACCGQYAEEKKFSGYFDVPAIRLFRNNPGIMFEGVVHEVVDASTEGLKRSYVDVCIHHYSNFETGSGRAQKSAFYLALLLAQLEKNPDDAKTWFLLGRQYYSLDRFAEAIVFLQKVVDSGSRCEMAYDNLACAYVNVGMLQQARLVLEKVLALNANYHEAYPTLGIVYSELGMMDEAERYLREAARYLPSSFKTFFNLAALCYKQKRYDEALAYLTEAEKVSSHMARVQYLKFYILQHLGDSSAACACAEKLRALDPVLFKNIEEAYAALLNAGKRE